MQNEKMLSFRNALFCAVCGSVLFIFGIKQHAHVDLSANHLIIPDIGVCENFAIAELTQESVDSNNIVYNVSRLGSENPIVCGHNYRALKSLHRTDVGDYIYIYLDGDYSEYIVVVSETASLIDGGRDFRGESGCNFIADHVDPALRIYTCYGDGRWIIIAKLVKN